VRDLLVYSDCREEGQADRCAPKTGLEVFCRQDSNLCPPGTKISDTESKTIVISGDDFHGEWNYAITPMST
jgi:hypothetical protein